VTCIMLTAAAKGSPGVNTIYCLYAEKSITTFRIEDVLTVACFTGLVITVTAIILTVIYK